MVVMAELPKIDSEGLRAAKRESAARVSSVAYVSRTTQYGFQYGANTIERLAFHKGYAVLGIKTPKQWLQITITPSGLIRLGKLIKNAKD